MSVFRRMRIRSLALAALLIGCSSSESAEDTSPAAETGVDDASTEDGASTESAVDSAATEDSSSGDSASTDTLVADGDSEDTTAPTDGSMLDASSDGASDGAPATCATCVLLKSKIRWYADLLVDDTRLYFREKGFGAISPNISGIDKATGTVTILHGMAQVGDAQGLFLHPTGLYCTGVHADGLWAQIQKLDLVTKAFTNLSADAFNTGKVFVESSGDAWFGRYSSGSTLFRIPAGTTSEVAFQTFPSKSEGKITIAAVDADYLYGDYSDVPGWSASKVMRISRTTKVREVYSKVDTSAQPAVLSIDATKLWYRQATEVFSVPLADTGGEPTLIGTLGWGTILPDGDGFLWLDGKAGIKRLAKTGALTTIDTGPLVPKVVAVDATDYWFLSVAPGGDSPPVYDVWRRPKP